MTIPQTTPAGIDTNTSRIHVPTSRSKSKIKIASGGQRIAAEIAENSRKFSRFLLNSPNLTSHRTVISLSYGPQAAFRDATTGREFRLVSGPVLNFAAIIVAPAAAVPTPTPKAAPAVTPPAKPAKAASGTAATPTTPPMWAASAAPAAVPATRPVVPPKAAPTAMEPAMTFPGFGTDIGRLTPFAPHPQDPLLPSKPYESPYTMGFDSAYAYVFNPPSRPIGSD